MAGLVEHHRASAVGDRLTADDRADPLRRGLEVEGLAGRGRLEVEFAGRLAAERPGARHETHAPSLARRVGPLREADASGRGASRRSGARRKPRPGVAHPHPFIVTRLITPACPLRGPDESLPLIE